MDKYIKIFILFLAIALTAVIASCNDLEPYNNPTASSSSGGIASSSVSPLSTSKTITAFSFLCSNNPGICLDVPGTITGTNISLTVPYLSTVTNLRATFTTTGASVRVGSSVQTTGVTINNFSNPVVYTVTAGDGTTQSYTVTVARTSIQYITLPLTQAGPSYYGVSVSLSENGNNIVIGANAYNSDEGEVAVFQNFFTGPVNVNGINDPGGSSGDYFGTSVCMSGDGNTFAVGACNPNEYPTSNPVYIYRWNGSSWNETSIAPSDGVTNSCFGYSLSLSTNGNILAVGAKWAFLEQGEVYVYRWNGTSWTGTSFTASDGMAYDHYGGSVSLSMDGSILAVGAYRKTIGTNSQQGKVYVYIWNGSSWAETGITASDGASNDLFGKSISLSSSGNSLAVGEGYFDEFYGKKGKAYIYNWNGSSWVETEITASDGAANDQFGLSVSLSGDGNSLAVGAYHKNNGQGKAYLYNWNGTSWGETGINNPLPGGMESTNFGVNVSLSTYGDVLAVADNSAGPLGGVIVLFY